MKKYLALVAIALLSAPNLNAATEVRSTQLSPAQSLTLDLSIFVPEGQKLSDASKIVICESSESLENQRVEYSFHELFKLGKSHTGVVRTEIPIKTNIDNSPLIFKAQIFHCSLSDGPCVMESFKGKVERRAGKTKPKNWALALKPKPAFDFRKLPKG